MLKYQDPKSNGNRDIYLDSPSPIMGLINFDLTLVDLGLGLGLWLVNYMMLYLLYQINEIL